MLLSYSDGLACLTCDSGFCEPTCLDPCVSWLFLWPSPGVLALPLQLSLTSIPRLRHKPFLSLRLINVLGTGSFSRAPDSLPITGYNRSFQSPQNTLNRRGLLCPISFQSLQALISSFYQDVSIQGQCKSSLPEIPILSFRSVSGCSLLLQHKVGGQSRWIGQKVPLDGFWLSHRLREMSTSESLWPCDALLRPAHLRAAIPVMNLQANKQA